MSNTAASKVKALRAPDGTWEIPLIGEIGETITGDSIIAFLQSAKPSEVKFIIRSPGGLAYDIIDAIDYMQSNGIKAWCEIYGDCMSAATFIMAYCTPERTSVSASARIGIHKASGPEKVFVDHANERMAALYKSAFGWSPAKIEKLLTANGGEGTQWMSGEDIVKAGLADEMLTEMRVAAHMGQFKEPTPDMGKVKAKGKLINVIALGGQEVEVEIDANAELEAANTALAQATSDRQAAESKAKEATDAEAAAQAKITELTTAKEAAEAAKVAAETTATEVTTKFNAEAEKTKALQAEVDKLRKLPTVPATKAQAGEGAQEPGATGPVLTDGQKQVKSIIDGMTPGERSALKKAAQRKADQAK